MTPPNHIDQPNQIAYPARIRHIPHRDIDPDKWDACIHRSPNGLIYGHSFYLDHMTDGQWDALVLEDYQAVMPLTWKKKWGIRYLYQPAFIQQLGIFSGEKIPPGLIEAFLAELHRHHRFAEIFLNCGNAHPTLQPYTNYILDLNQPYPEIASHYTKKLQNSLKKEDHAAFHYIGDPQPADILARSRQLYGHRIPHVREGSYRRFQALCSFLQDKGQLVIRGVRDGQQQLLATALLPRDKNRLYLQLSTVSPAGRQGEANHFLLDRLIHEFAGQPLVLDFEGSEEPGIAHFYRSFGSLAQPYFFHRHNELAWPLKLFK